MAQTHRRQYGTATTVDFELATLAGDDLKMDATFVAGDVTISKDEAAEGNIATLPTDRGTGYSLALSAAELTCARAIVHIRDLSGPQIWLSRSIIIETEGHPLAQHKDSTLIDSGVAQAGGANSITLATTAPPKIDPGSVIVLKGGTGGPAAGIVDSYTFATKVVVMTAAWVTPPAVNTPYDVYTGPPDIDLSAATIQAVSGAVGSVTGAVGSVAGNVGGNVVGSVGLIAANGITASSLAADAITAAKVATDAITEITAGILNAAAASYNAGGSVGAQINSAASAGDPMTAVVPGGYALGTAGYKIGTHLDANITSRSSHSADAVTLDMDANSVALSVLQGYTDTLEAQLALVKAKTDLMAFTGTDLAVTMTPTERTALIDAILAKTLIPANVAPNTVGGALVSRIRWTQVGTTVTIQTADGLTNLFQLSLTVDPVSGAITAVTPV